MVACVHIKGFPYLLRRPVPPDKIDFSVFTIFAKKMSREKRIPFEVSVDPFYSDRNMTAIDEAAEQIERGQVVVKTMEELEAMENK